MPSIALLNWQNDRLPRLGELENQCSATLALVPPNPRLVEENLRGVVVALSAHFQGFCRDLHAEAAQVIVLKLRPSLQAVIQNQFKANLALKHGNPTIDNSAKDL